MDLANLSAAFEHNRVAILGTAAAGVVGFALYQRHKSAGATGAVGQGVATVAGGASAGGQLAGATGAAAYDSTSSDLYGAFQPQLESIGGQLSQLLNQVPVTQAPPTGAKPSTKIPAAAQLVTPNYNGHYISTTGLSGVNTPAMFEVENDGSLLALTPDQRSQAAKLGGANYHPETYNAPTTAALLNGTTFYTDAGNIAALNGGTAGAKGYQLGGAQWKGVNPLAASAVKAATPTATTPAKK